MKGQDSWKEKMRKFRESEAKKASAKRKASEEREVCSH